MHFQSVKIFFCLQLSWYKLLWNIIVYTTTRGMILEKEDEILKVFKKEKVLTIKQLKEFLICSERTVQRRLIQWGTYRSYNQNGRYYVLQSVPTFDEYGLWRYRGIFFSKNGNLRETVLSLINNSPSGLTVNEIDKHMRVSLKSFLSQERNIGELCREKKSGRFVFFSSDEKVYAAQKHNRDDSEIRIKLTQLPTDAEAVIILVEQIKYPHLSIEQLSKRLKKKGQRISSKTIRTLFECHGLTKKKVGTK